MFDKGRKTGTCRFAFKAGDGSARASLAGDFNAWQPARMRKQKDGSFALTVPLAPGTYEYKFIVDGEWVVDGDNSTYAMNPYGTINSVAVVE